MKKSLYIAFLFLFFLQGCAQEKKERTMTILTAPQRIDYLKKHIQRYNYEPLYYMETKTNLNYQVLVNDFPVYTHFGPYGSMKFNINSSILQSGKQKLEIKVYPRYTNKTTQNEFFDSKGYFKLILTETSWRKDGGGLEEPKTMLEYELPKENTHTGYTIDYAKLQRFTDSLSFEATVPYQLQGWTNGEVFKEEDSLQLKAQVASFYKDIREAFENNEENYLSTKYLEANREWYQSEYFPDDLIQRLQDGSHVKEKYEKKYFPLENYKLGIYGNGRILCLETISGENKGNSALGYTYENENREGIRFLDLYLYRPKGSSQFQIIR